MRILYGFWAGCLWLAFCLIAMVSLNVEISNDIQWLTLSIVVAGTMAGGEST